MKKIIYIFNTPINNLELYSLNCMEDGYYEIILAYNKIAEQLALDCSTDIIRKLHVNLQEKEISLEIKITHGYQLLFDSI